MGAKKPWEDTVMSNEQIREQTKAPIVLSGHKRLAEAQSEITWSIAHKIGYDKALAQLAGMTEECKQMGRREVIEWTEREFGIDWSEEKEQLEKWGIKDANK